ncbi:MAG TPA: hypothetical protein VF457_11450 [Burkholderiaceae bacterium]
MIKTAAVVTTLRAKSHDSANVEYLLVGGAELRVIDVDDLRANKRAAGRAKDLADLEALDEDPDGPPAP